MNEEEIQRIFADPENQRRVNVWYQREAEDTAQVIYKPLSEKYPSINKIFEEIKSRKGIQAVSLIRVMRDTLEVILNLQTLESPQTIPLRKGLEIANRLIPEVNKFYLGVIAETKS